MNIKTVYIEITNKCNLNCRTCYNRSGLNSKRKEISKNQLEDIIKLFSQYGLERLLLSGGEPTLHTEFDEILDLVDKYPEISFGIVTNGTNHNPKLIEILNNKENFTLQISLDGSCEEKNSKTRGAGHFEDSIKFAKSIHKPNKKPLLKMVISQNNYDDIENFYKLALSLGFTPEFAFIYKSGNGSDEWENKAVSAKQKIAAINLIDKLNSEYKEEAFLPLCLGDCPYCYGFSDLSLCVKVDGTIQPCQSLYDSRFSVGNVFSFNIDDFMEKLNFISSLAKKRKTIDFGCEKCVIKSGCQKGCIASAVNTSGDPFANDGDCYVRKLQIFGYNLKKVMKDNKKII